MFRRQTNVIAPAFEALLKAHQLGDVDGVYRCAAGDVITRSGSTEVRRVTLGTGSTAPTVFIKKYWISRPKQLWSGMFRGTLFGCPKARREFENLALLRTVGLDAPEPIAFGEERKAGWLMRSYLISLGVPEPKPLHQYIRDDLMALTGETRHKTRRRLIENLAAYTRRLHDQGFLHHDYFWRNILLSHGGIDHFYLIDAHKGRRTTLSPNTPARASDLAALDSAAPRFFSRSERLRFFLLYRGQRQLNSADKALLRRTLELAGPMRERQLGRVLGRGRKLQP
jgi:tRNA A-37 threonylcarbamoyl transferase component Bud32